MARPPADDPKGIHLAARLDGQEAAAVEAFCDATKLNKSDLVRRGVLGLMNANPSVRATRPYRRPIVEDKQELARLLGAVGRIGSNVNQLAHTANSGGWPESSALNEAVADIQWIRRTLMVALGVTPEQPQPRPSG